MSMVDNILPFHTKTQNQNLTYPNMLYEVQQCK